MRRDYQGIYTPRLITHSCLVRPSNPLFRSGLPGLSATGEAKLKLVNGPYLLDGEPTRYLMGVFDGRGQACWLPSCNASSCTQ